MAEDKAPGGLFGYGIIPTGNRDEMERAAYQRRQAQALERGNFAAQGRLPGYQRMSEQFAMGMEQLAQGRAGTSLSPREQQSLAIKQAGTAAFNDWLAERRNAGEEVSQQDQQIKLMTEMQKAAMATGDVDTFTQLGQAITASRQNQRMNEAKLREAEGAARSADPRNPAYQREIASELWNPGQRGQIRDGRMAFRKQLDTYDGVVTMFENMVDEGIDPNTAAVGAIGEPLSFLQKAASTLGAAKNEFKRFFMTDDEGNTVDAGAIDGSVAGMDRLRRQSPKFADALDMIVVPAAFNKSAEARAKYQAATIRMAYAAWRQNEGSGSRQASDQDIINALKSIGADSGDFRIMMSTTLQTVREGLDAQVREQAAIEEMGRYHGLTPEFTDSYFGGSISKDIPRVENLFERSDYLSSQFSPQTTTEAAAEDEAVNGDTAYGGFDSEDEYNEFLDSFLD